MIIPARIEPPTRSRLGAPLEESRQTFDLTAPHDVVREWQGRLDTAPAVAALIASGFEDADSVALEDVIGARPPQ
ncbi:DUF6247 family protein [Streptomyces subrutilus]|uniref:Uncharacterized protein n=1 Tax=Streptomyces subrutilus TaxID=36818 RepID=A0A1E5PLF7_9ACTN|nr:DUF6247 family protein [Streptomyces subrutilus]OEJ30354.1 hypothetical protein BGK67_02380 [Streptomyces subrutilus]